MRARHGFGKSSSFSLFNLLSHTVDVKLHPRANGKKCILCKKCEIICPTGAIHVLKEEHKWRIYGSRCVKCYKCINTCPTNAINII